MTKTLTIKKAWELIAQSFVENVEFEGKCGPARMYPSYSTGICARVVNIYSHGLITEHRQERMLDVIKEHLEYPKRFLSMNSDRASRSLFCLLLAEQMENE